MLPPQAGGCICWRLIARMDVTVCTHFCASIDAWHCSLIDAWHCTQLEAATKRAKADAKAKEKRQLDRLARTRTLFRDVMVQINSASTFSGACARCPWLHALRAACFCAKYFCSCTSFVQLHDR
jgi:hypothetical protein